MRAFLGSGTNPDTLGQRRTPYACAGVSKGKESAHAFERDSCKGDQAGLSHRDRRVVPQRGLRRPSRRGWGSDTSATSEKWVSSSRDGRTWRSIRRSRPSRRRAAGHPGSAHIVPAERMTGDGRSYPEASDSLSACYLLGQPLSQDCVLSGFVMSKVGVGLTEAPRGFLDLLRPLCDRLRIVGILSQPEVRETSGNLEYWSHV